MTDREKLIEAMASSMYSAGFGAECGDYSRRGEPVKSLYRELAHAALSAIEAMGAVVVPVDATDEMDEAGWVRLCDHTHLTAEDIYAVMLAASPFAKGSTP